jgi:hypothetical protein
MHFISSFQKTKPKQEEENNVKKLTNEKLAGMYMSCESKETTNKKPPYRNHHAEWLDNRGLITAQDFYSELFYTAVSQHLVQSGSQRVKTRTDGRKNADNYWFRLQALDLFSLCSAMGQEEKKQCIEFLNQYQVPQKKLIISVYLDWIDPVKKSSTADQFQKIQMWSTFHFDELQKAKDLSSFRSRDKE